jgi:hypothetical protein
MTNNHGEFVLSGIPRTLPATHDGSWMRIVRKAAMVPYTFVLLNWAAVSGLFHYLRGHSGTWESAQ